MSSNKEITPEQEAEFRKEAQIKLSGILSYLRMVSANDAVFKSRDDVAQQINLKSDEYEKWLRRKEKELFKDEL